MTRDELIAAMKADGASDLIKVEVPRWGVLYVRPVTVQEAETFGKPGEEGGEQSQFAILAARVICDEKGKRLFDPENPADLALLAARRSSDLMKVITAGTEQGN